MKRKHAEVIKAWADGAEIQYRPHPDSEWVDASFFSDYPMWFDHYEYRVKPDPVTVVTGKLIERDGWLYAYNMPKYGVHNVKATFNYSGKLIEVELLKE